MDLLFFLSLVFLFCFYVAYRNFRRETLSRLQRLEGQLNHLEALRPEVRQKTRPAGETDGAGKAPAPALSTDRAYSQKPPSSQPLSPHTSPVEKTTASTQARPLKSPRRSRPIERNRLSALAALAAKWKNFKVDVNWEQFTGVKLFAWLGGFALFIATGFFVKFSIDRDLISPVMRLAMGTLTGTGLIIGAQRLSAGRYAVLRQTLAAGGIGMLYSVIFAATLYYHYLPNAPGFVLLALVSASAFVLAVHYHSLALSILGAVGAYLTPLLVRVDQGSLALLYGYLVIVNIGLYQVVRRLKSQLLLMTAALGTLTVAALNTWFYGSQIPDLEIAWVWIAHMVLFSFFLRRSDQDPGSNTATLVTGVVTYAGVLAASLFLTTRPGWSPLLVQTAAASGAFALARRRRGWYRLSVPFSVMVFLAALTWTWLRFTPEVFSFSFILLLIYGFVGSVGPVLLANKYGLARHHLGWLKVFPVAVMLMVLGVLLGQEAVSFWFWPLVLLLHLIGIGLSAVLRATLQLFLLPALFLAAALYWLFGMSDTAVGPGFFFFLLMAVAILCAAFFIGVPRLQQYFVKLCPPAAAPPLCPPILPLRTGSPMAGRFARRRSLCTAWGFFLYTFPPLPPCGHVHFALFCHASAGHRPPSGDPGARGRRPSVRGPGTGCLGAAAGYLARTSIECRDLVRSLVCRQHHPALYHLPALWPMEDSVVRLGRVRGLAGRVSAACRVRVWPGGFGPLVAPGPGRSQTAGRRHAAATPGRSA